MADYTNLINKGGTIYDTQTGTGFATESELRKARNITAPTEWGKIPKNDAWKFSGSQITDTWTPGYVGTGMRDTPPTPDELAEGGLPSDFQLGDVLDGSSDIFLNLTGTESMAEVESEILELQKSMLGGLKEEKEEKKTMFEGFIKKREEIKAPDYQDLYEQTLAKYGWTPEQYQGQKELLTKITGFKTKIAQLDTIEQQKLSATEQELAPLGYIEGKKALIRRQAAVEKAGLAAQAGVLQMEFDANRGMMADAQGMADRIINIATQEYQQNIQDFDAFANLYSDYISSMSESDQKIIEVAYQANVDALSTKKDDLQQKLDLKLKAASQGISLPFDINTTSLEDALDMYAKKVGIQNAAEAAAKGVSAPKTVPWSMAAWQAGIVGMSQAEAQAIVTSTVPTEAFINEQNLAAGASLAPSVLQKRWDAYKEKITQPEDETMNQWETEAVVWQWLETAEAQALTEEEKASQIRSFGLNPEKFNIYTY